VRKYGSGHVTAWVIAATLLLLILPLGISTSGLGTPLIVSANQRSAPRIYLGELAGTSRVCQTFVATYERLSEVQVRMHNLGKRTDAPFLFHLRTSPEGENLVTVESSTSQVGYEDYVRFAFAPIPESAGKTWTFCLEAPQVELSEAVTVWGVLEDTYPDGEILLFGGMWGQEVGVQDLNFRLGYSLDRRSKVEMIVRRIAEYKPFLCGSRWFYALLVLAYLGLKFILFNVMQPER